MRGEHEQHLAPADVDVGVMVGLLGGHRDRVDQRDRRRKVGGDVPASDVGGIPEAASGLPTVTLVPADDPGALASALTAALDEPPTPRPPAMNWNAFSTAVARLLA